MRWGPVIVIVPEFFELGESKSKLGPPEGVLEPVLVEGDSSESLTGDGAGSMGATALDFSWPVTASEMARRPKCRDDEADFTGNNQSFPFDDLGEVVFSYGRPSSLVTAGDVKGEGKSFGGGAGRGGVLIELSEGVLRRPFTDKP